MTTPQSIQDHFGITHHLKNFWHSGTLALSPECQKLKNGGLDQKGPERFGRLIFATVRKMWEWKG